MVAQLDVFEGDVLDNRLRPAAGNLEGMPVVRQGRDIFQYHVFERAGILRQVHFYDGFVSTRILDTEITYTHTIDPTILSDATLINDNPTPRALVIDRVAVFSDAVARRFLTALRRKDHVNSERIVTPVDHPPEPHHVCGSSDVMRVVLPMDEAVLGDAAAKKVDAVGVRTPVVRLDITEHGRTLRILAAAHRGVVRAVDEGKSLQYGIGSK